jgi:hypothetical protein
MAKALCTLTLALLLSARVFAADAHALYERGVKALAEGKARQALTSFEAAYKAQPVPTLFFWIGEAHRALGHKERAASNYQRYLDELPYGSKKEEAQARLAELKKGQPKSKETPGRLALEDLNLNGPSESLPEAGTAPGRGKSNRRAKKLSKAKAEQPAPVKIVAVPQAPPAAPPPAAPLVAPPLPGQLPALDKSAAALPAPPAAPPAPPVEPAQQKPVESAPASQPAGNTAVAQAQPPPVKPAIRPPAPGPQPTVAAPAPVTWTATDSFLYVQYTARLLAPGGSFMGQYSTTSTTATLYTHGIGVGLQTQNFRNGLYLGFGTEYGGVFGAGTDTLLRYEVSWQCVWIPMGPTRILSPHVGFRLGGMGVKSERLTGGSLKPGVVLAAQAGLDLAISRWFLLTGGLGYDANLGPDLGPTASTSGFAADFGGMIRF